MVGATEVLAVVAEASGIPAEHLSQTNWHPLAQLEARLRQRVAGQDAAVAAAVGAVRLGRLGMQGGQRPLASLLLTGPAGVGKATLCHALASTLFGSDRHLLRFNLAEYSDRASGKPGLLRGQLLVAPGTASCSVLVPALAAERCGRAGLAGPSRP